MSTMATVLIDTAHRRITHRDFFIQELRDAAGGIVWEWSHVGFGMQGDTHCGVTGDSPSMWGAIEAVNAWYEQREAA